MKRNLVLFAALALLAPAAFAQDGQTGRATASADMQVHYDASRGVLVVEPAGQEAIDRLFPASRNERSMRRQYNDLSTELFERLRAGETTAIESLFAPSERAEATADVTRLLGMYEAGYGPVTDFVVVGSQPRAVKGGTYTHVTVTFGSTPVTLRLLWHEGHLVTMYPGTPARTVPLRQPAPVETAAWMR